MNTLPAHVAAEAQKILNRAAQRILTDKQKGENVNVGDKVREPWWPTTGHSGGTGTGPQYDYQAIWRTHQEHPLITHRQLAQMFHCTAGTISRAINHYKNQ